MKEMAPDIILDDLRNGSWTKYKENTDSESSGGSSQHTAAVSDRFRTFL